ncbi:MAG TPA: ATP-binding protein [Polyangiaceae bacterium]|nr:ATP-binding protein [Polyangiaceae bacterium]
MVEDDARAPKECAPRISSSPAPVSLRDTWNSTADRYTALIEAADDAVLVAEFDPGAVIEANPAACELFGFPLEELVGKSIRELHFADDEDVERVLSEIVERERAWHPNLKCRRRDGSFFWAELRAKAFLSRGHKLVLYIVRDVTHRVEKESELARAYQSLKDAQAKLVHSGKLAAIGQIAGGVAHEVNNPATFILTNLRVMRDAVALLRRSVSTLRRELASVEGLPDDTRMVVEGILESGDMDSVLRETSEMVEDNLAGIERIASIVNDLRIFSRIEQDDVQNVRVNDIVDAACNLAFADIRHRARLVKELSKLPPVAAEPGKLAQVFTNLLLNAAQSIEPGAAHDNEIRVSTFLEDDFVCVVIRDTGVGMTEAARKRILEPFYSAGNRDYGTGLGLSLSAEIVRMHGGSIDIEEAEDRGTRFIVKLPAPAETAETPEEMDSVAPALNAPVSRRARILVIDDDLAVLRAYRRMLSSRHDVVLASGGQEGLDLLSRDEDFDIVLCDVMMPQVDGPMVYDALVARLPHVAERVVFVSGGAFTPRAKEFLARVKNTFLAKPIEPELLERAIGLAREARAPSRRAVAP